MLIKLNKSCKLHLFDAAAAPGADASSADSGVATTKAEEKEPVVVYGKDTKDNQDDSQAGVATGDEGQIDKATAFKELIKGEYKDEYNALFKEHLNKRLSDRDNQIQAETEQTQALLSVINPLYTKYGIEPGDTEALNKAIQADDALYEEAAEEQGLTVEQYKNQLRIENENRELRAAQIEKERTEKADILYNRWLEESEAVKEIYPNFNLEIECEENPKFKKLLGIPDMDVQTAYEISHKDEILKSVAQTVADTVRQNTVDSIRTKGSRPSENGITEQAGIIRKDDVNKLSAEERAEVAKRAKRGERITF